MRGSDCKNDTSSNASRLKVAVRLRRLVMNFLADIVGKACPMR